MFFPARFFIGSISLKKRCVKYCAMTLQGRDHVDDSETSYAESTTYLVNYVLERCNRWREAVRNERGPGEVDHIAKEAAKGLYTLDELAQDLDETPANLPDQKEKAYWSYMSVERVFRDLGTSLSERSPATFSLRNGNMEPGFSADGYGTEMYSLPRDILDETDRGVSDIGSEPTENLPDLEIGLYEAMVK
jgi:hypothetical protein